MTRLKNNLRILGLLERIVKHYPELRFCQILEILNSKEDRFYEESKETCERFRKFIEENNIPPQETFPWIEEGLKKLGYNGSGDKRLEI